MGSGRADRPGGRRATALALLLALCSSLARADDPGKRTLLLAKALSYERRLAETKGGSVGIAVLFLDGDAASQASASRWIQSFQMVAPLKVHGVPVEAWAVPYQPTGLSELVRAKGIDVLLACDGVPFAAIAQVARERRVLSAADTRAGIDGRLSLGVFVEGGRPRILINARSAKAEGAEFSAKLLQLADVL
jgi:YfiR/HmsC-like